MLHVIGDISTEHDRGLVLLGALLCFFSCFTAVSMIARVHAAGGAVRRVWICAAGLLTGCGVWATHFVWMLAYKSPLAIGFDIRFTILSALIAIALSGLGYWLALDRARPVLGSAVLGLAMGAMHYTGMAAVEIHAHGIWSPAYVIVSLLLGVGLTMPAISLAMRDDCWAYQFGGAALFALAIASLHFTGMSALVYRLDPLVPVHDVLIEPSMLAAAVAAVAFSIVALGLIGSLVDHHLERHAVSEAQRLRRHIDELEATKRELLLAKSQAEAGNRAKSIFLANMSHELRTPLNAIIGFAELIRNQVLGPVSPVKYGEYVLHIHKSGEHLLSLINDILDLAKIEAGRRELDEREVNLDSVARHAMNFVRPQATVAQVHLRTDIAVEAAFWGDERGMKQMMANLLSNAVKYSRPNGEVCLFARQTDAGIEVGVEDRGIGMSPEGIKIALEPFGQAATMKTVDGSGTGLGLAIVKALVEAHGGVFRLESALDKGTRAWAEFPPARLRRPNLAA